MLLVVEEPDCAEQQKAAAETDAGIVPMVRRLFRNPVYIKYLLFKAPASMAFEIPNSILLYYIQYSVQDTNPNSIKGSVTIVVVLGSLLAIPFTVFLTSKFTKRQVLCGFLVCYGGFLTLATLIPPVVELVYMIGFVVGFGMGAYYVIPDAILGDLIDYDEFHTGSRSESSYTVIETNLQQFMEVGLAHRAAIRRPMIEPLVELYGGCMVVL